MTSKRSTVAVAIAAAGVATMFGLSACSSSTTPTSDATPEATATASSTADTGTGQELLAPSSFKSPAVYANGLSVQVVSTARVVVQPQGPGEVAGDGVRFSVKLTNNTDSEIKLDNVVVNAFYGANKTPASPNPSSDTPFTGSLAKGATAEAAYVFLIPKGSGPVEMQFSYSTTQPVAVFVGKV